MPRLPFRSIVALCGWLAIAGPLPAQAEQSPETADSVSSAPAQTYADLADLALPAEVVVRAQIRQATRLKPAQAPDLPASIARVYIVVRTSSLLVGPALGESLSFLADVPLDERGKLPKLNKSQVLVFARTVPGKPGQLALVAPDAMIAWTPDAEQRLRAILTERNSPDAPPHITALREALHVPGNLAGEGETQFFFATEGGKPVSLSVVRRPGQPTTWGVSFSEIVDQAARPPEKDTLGWYRLACELPPRLPDGTNIAERPRDRQAASEDYALIMADLGPCARQRAHR